jgi:hypothetical protein
MFPEISADLSKQENLKIISSYLNMENDDEVIQYLKDRDLDIDRALENKLVTSATKLVDSVINLWESKLRIENFTSFIQIGLDLKIFEVLTQNLKTTFEMLNVRNELIQIFEQKTRMVFSPMDTEEFLASISSAFINDFVSNFGYNFMGKDRLIELESVCLQYKMDLSIVNKTSINHSNKINLGAIYDELESVQSNSSPLLENFNSYIMKIKLALLSNCGFVNYDVNANNELNNLINELEEIDFTIE